MAESGLKRELIPRVMHRIWFGDKPIPAQYELYWQAWQRHLPDFEFRTWREADVDEFLTRETMARAEGMARKADIARYEILLRHGGIYMDCDIFPLQPFDLNLLQHELVVCNEIEADHYCSIGFIAAAPANPALHWAVDAVMTCSMNKRQANEETGPWLFRQALAHSRYFKLPVAAFYPYLYNEPFSAILQRDLSGTLGVHVWGGSWFNEQQRLGKLIDRLNRGDLEEPAQLAAEGGPDDPHGFVEYCGLARAARQHALAVARHRIVEGQVRIDNAVPLEFVKAALSLLTQAPESMVWHIGAANGLLNGDVRALLVNFDPPAVLVEPNPYLHAMLARNYRNNGKAKLVQAALSAERGTLTLNAINPASVQAAGLPEPVLGLSVPAARSDLSNALAGGDEFSRRISECFEPAQCEAVDVDQLLDLHDGAYPAIVVVEGLGAAADAVGQILGRGLEPLILYFSRHGLSNAELDGLASLLEAGYVTVGEGEDMVAYRADFFSTYCEQIYVENGIHTIYKDALRFALNLG